MTPILLLATVAVTFFYTWLFIHTGGSVFITIIAHATEGVIGRELIGDDAWTGADGTNFALLYTALWCAVALALLVFDRKLWRVRLPWASAFCSRPSSRPVLDPRADRALRATAGRLARGGSRPRRSVASRARGR